MSHEDHVGFGQRLLEEISGLKAESLRNAQFRNVFFEDWADYRQIEADSAKVRIRKRNLNSEVALRRARIDEGFLFRPWKILGNREVGRATYAGHGLEEMFPAVGV